MRLCTGPALAAHQEIFDPSFRHGCWCYVRSCDVVALSDEVIDAVVQYGRRISAPVSGVGVRQMGGPVARIPDDATTFNAA